MALPRDGAGQDRHRRGARHRARVPPWGCHPHQGRDDPGRICGRPVWPGSAPQPRGEPGHGAVVRRRRGGQRVPRRDVRPPVGNRAGTAPPGARDHRVSEPAGRGATSWSDQREDRRLLRRVRGSDSQRITASSSRPRTYLI
jgi:hypothetical protein